MASFGASISKAVSPIQTTRLAGAIITHAPSHKSPLPPGEGGRRPGEGRKSSDHFIPTNRHGAFAAPLLKKAVPPLDTLSLLQGALLVCPLPPGEGGRRPGEGRKFSDHFTPARGLSHECPLPLNPSGRRLSEGLRDHMADEFPTLIRPAATFSRRGKDYHTGGTELSAFAQSLPKEKKAGGSTLHGRMST